LGELGAHLEPGGLLVFHMHLKGTWADDQAAVREVFAHTRSARRTGSLVIFASHEPFADPDELSLRARAVDIDKGWSISLADQVADLQRRADSP
jgi:hypothetical protein